MAEMQIIHGSSSWCRACPGDGNRNVSQDAYANAVIQLKSELGGASKGLASVDPFAAVQEIGAIVNEAKQMYDPKRKNHTETRQWLEKLSYSIMVYLRVFESISVHHREGVGLAWGAIKFVLMAIINRTELVQKLSQALVAIAEVLPKANLNATPCADRCMESALSRLYTYIIMFSVECVQWSKRTPMDRVFSAAIKDPFETHYWALLEQIKQCSGDIDTLANIEWRAESSHSHDLLIRQELRLREHDAKFVEMLTGFEKKVENSMKQLLQYGYTNNTMLERISVDTRATNERTIRLEFHQVLKFFTPKVLPDKALLKIQYLMLRNPSLTLPSPSGPRVKRELLDWVSEERSSLLVVRVGIGAQKQAKELAADVIKQLNSNAQPVLWSLSLSNDSENTVTMADVFKGIIFQLLQKFDHLRAEFAEQLNLTHIDSPHTDSEWVDLICLLLSKIPEAFFVLETEDLHQVYREDPEWADQFLRLLQTIVDRTGAAGSKIKILLVMYGSAMNMELTAPAHYSLVQTNLQAAVEVPPRLRHVAQRSGLETKGWKLQRPKMRGTR